ncbi:unnamed protein product [Hydatigera taeniaeformis]|uniref:cDNA n=1 Tax=Hydatigena taeniaeformis TaxID=6205 RepID=A0A0R3X124_HYDTA|nr:unnamed protein product [Hydatigera taeniaeformis]
MQDAMKHWNSGNRLTPEPGVMSMSCPSPFETVGEVWFDSSHLPKTLHYPPTQMTGSSPKNVASSPFPFSPHFFPLHVTSSPSLLIFLLPPSNVFSLFPEMLVCVRLQVRLTPRILSPPISTDLPEAINTSSGISGQSGYHTRITLTLFHLTPVYPTTFIFAACHLRTGWESDIAGLNVMPSPAYLLFLPPPLTLLPFPLFLIHYFPRAGIQDHG